MRWLLSLAPLFLFAQEECIRYGNPPCSLCENGIGAEVFADFIYAQPMIESLGYAIRNDVRQQYSGGPNGTPGGPILDLKSDWHPAFRIAVSYVPSLTARFVWMHLFSKTTSHSHMDQSLPELGLEGTWIPAIDSVTLYSTALLRWDLNFDVLDLELGKCYRVSPLLTMNPACSIRIARINQSFQAVYNQDKVDTSNDFFGAGIRMLLDSEWSFVRDWTMFARAAASMIYGKFETSYNFFPTPPLSSALLQNISGNFYRLEPNAEFSVGVGWERCLSKGHCRLGFRVSYEAQIFWDQLELRQPLGSDAPALALLQTRDLSIQGFALRGQLAF